MEKLKYNPKLNIKLPSTEEEIITLWDTTFKTSGKDGLSGFTNEKEGIIAFYGDEKEAKRPYIKGYFTKENK